MPRALTTIVLLLFALGSGLNLDCLVRCAPSDLAAASTAACHEPSDDDLKLAASADCADDQVAPSPAIVTGRLVVTSGWLMALAAETQWLPRYTSAVLIEAPSLPAAGPPIPFAHTPLRL